VHTDAASTGCKGDAVRLKFRVGNRNKVLRLGLKVRASVQNSTGRRGANRRKTQCMCTFTEIVIGGIWMIGEVPRYRWG
jgi:hypothetical protein